MHKCNKMPIEEAHKRDCSFIHFYHDNDKTIYYCIYCGENMRVEEIKEG